MRKISLKNVNTKSFTNLIKRSSSMDKMIFITLTGNEFESIAYNKHSTALKRVEADFEKICETYVNECGNESVKISFADAGNVISVLGVVGNNNVNITFDIDDENYARKVCFENKDLLINISCADKDAVDFLTLNESRRAKVFDENSGLRFSVNISENEFSSMKSLFSLNKDSVRVFFYMRDGELGMSEIEAVDENVREEINMIIKRSRGTEDVPFDQKSFDDFDRYEKMYNKKLSISNFESFSSDEKFLACFNKQYFPWIDDDKEYTFTFHENRVIISSFNENELVKTTICLAPVMFG